MLKEHGEMFTAIEAIVEAKTKGRIGTESHVDAGALTISKQILNDVAHLVSLSCSVCMQVLEKGWCKTAPHLQHSWLQ